MESPEPGTFFTLGSLLAIGLCFRQWARTSVVARALARRIGIDVDARPGTGRVIGG
jgi:hypothetical protein